MRWELPVKNGLLVRGLFSSVLMIEEARN